MIFTKTMMVFTLQMQWWGVILNVFLVVICFLPLSGHLMYPSGDAISYHY